MKSECLFYNSRFFLFFCISLVVINTAKAQRSDYKKYYSEVIEASSKIVDADVQFVKEITKDGRFLKKQFYPETKQITHLMEYSNGSFSELNGTYVEYYDNGNLWKQGEYKNAQASGEWKFYSFPDGRLFEFGHYENNLREGVWTVVDSLGQPIEFTNYVNGNKHGNHVVIEVGGDTTLFEKFAEGELVETLIAKEKDVNLVEKMPRFPGCDSTLQDSLVKACAQNLMLQFVYKSIRYPSSAQVNEIQGKAIMQFVIDKDGSVRDVVAQRGISRAIENECKRIINSMPAWEPGIKNGEAVNVRFLLPINFKLE